MLDNSRTTMMGGTKALLRTCLVLADVSGTPRKLLLSLRFWRALAIGLPMMLTSVLCAQEPEASSPVPRPPHHIRRAVTQEDRVKVLARSLNLDPAQQTAVLKILQARNVEALSIRRDTSISGSARIDQFRALQDKTVLKIRALLNEEQRKKYDPLAVRTVGPAADQKTVEDWLELTTPK
jgi:hypothetical protein